MEDGSLGVLSPEVVDTLGLWRARLGSPVTSWNAMLRQVNRKNTPHLDIDREGSRESVVSNLLSKRIHEEERVPWRKWSPQRR